jgi:soluble lytic murein transglycosylase
MGLAEESAAELGAVDLGGSGEAEPLLVVADLLDRAGDHRAAHQILRTRARAALVRSPRAEDLRAWRIAYPPAFRDVAKRFAPPSGVPVDLLLALVREESALDPRALSPAGAVGLAQLMLPTARHLAAEAGLPRPTRADLMKADVNLRLGARYLGQLVRRFDGSAVLALAAYNAGPTSVLRWLAERGDEDLDAFVEDIPYDETRAYVKRVLRSYAAYRLLYGSSGEASVPLPLALPAMRGRHPGWGEHVSPR